MKVDPKKVADGTSPKLPDVKASVQVQKKKLSSSSSSGKKKVKVVVKAPDVFWVLLGLF